MADKKTKKILFLMQLPPPVHGAAVISQSILNSEKVKNAFRISSINISTARTISDIGKGGTFKLFKSVGLWFKTCIRIISFRPQIVYITLSPVGPAFLKDAMLVMISKIFSRAEMVIHLHGKGIKKAMNTSPSAGFYQLVFKNTNVIHLSKSLLDDLSGIRGLKSKRVVNNGIADGSIEKIPHKGINIIYLSNMVRSKGALTLLEATKILKDRGVSGFQVHFAGEWFESDFREEFMSYLSANNLDETCHYKGSVYGEEKQQFFASADLMVFPTSYPNECFPLVILEALSYGIPVISTNEGAIPEIIDDGTDGFIIPAKNPEMLSETLELILDDNEQLNNMSVAARTKYSEKYQLDRFISNLIIELSSL